jgi:hypothetical protein
MGTTGEVIEIERRECIDNNDMANVSDTGSNNVRTLNKQVPSRTKSEYYVDNQEILSSIEPTTKKKILNS